FMVAPGAGQVSQGAPGDAAVEVRFRKAAIDLDGLIEVCQRLCEILLSQKESPALVVSARQVQVAHIKAWRAGQDCIGCFSVDLETAGFKSLRVDTMSPWRSLALARLM